MIIAVIGLGYVGAPLAVELSKHFTVIGYDINDPRVQELARGHDRTGEIPEEELKSAQVIYTSNLLEAAQASTFIVTVPTPVGEGNVPDLGPVMKATKALGTILRPRSTVIYESTVYPGVTEEICVPILEKESHLRWKEDFNVGYSPERINPGDKVHTLTTTTKIVAGDTPTTLKMVDFIYRHITQTYKAPTIRVAEGAKVIENIQRDVNIALMNELSQIFSRMGIDTHDVIAAAASKWNFQRFSPGLVGGHCISVDPYYLSHKAATQGFVADVILSAREVNDSMASFVVDQLIKRMSRHGLLGPNPIVTILGCTFKENVPDIRNSKVFDIIDQLKTYGITAEVVDPHADVKEVRDAYHVTLADRPINSDAVILAVPHDEFLGWDNVMSYADTGRVVVMDLKGVLDRETKPEGIDLWRP